MSASSPSLDEEIAKLNVDVERLKQKAAAAPGPEQGKVKRMVLQMVGIWDIIKEQQRDCTKLMANLIFVMDHVLNRMSSDVRGQGIGDATAKSVFPALVRLASDIAHFLQKPVEMKEQVGTERQDAILKFIEDLDAMRLKVVEVRITMVEQVAGLYASSLDAKHPEIPPKPAVFFGRDELVASIVQLLLRDRASRIPLLGTGGIGKTSVAVTAINDGDVRTKYGRDILFVSCESTSTAEGIIQKLALALGLPHDSDARTSLFRYLRSRRCFLLILDNLETAVYSEDGEHVHQLLAEFAQLPGLSLMITMRGDLPPVGVEWEGFDAMHTLSLDAAHKIWTEIARKTDKKLDELLGRLDGLPLAIWLMAHQGKYFTPTQLLASYEKSAAKLMKVGGGGRLGSLQVSIELSLASKILLEEPGARELLSLICLLPDGAAIEALEDIVPSMSDALLPAASALQQVALAFDRNGRLKVLSPIRDVILLRRPPDGRSLDELRDFFMGLCSRAHDIGSRNGKDSVQLLSVEFGNINSILVHFWKAPPDGDNIPHLFSATTEVVYFSQICNCGDPTALLAEAQRRLDMTQYRHAAAECRRRLGNVLQSQCRDAEAITMLEEAKLAFVAMDMPLGAARCTQSLGNILRGQSRYTEAMAMLKEAKLVFEAIGQPLGAAQCMQSLGSLLRMHCRYAEAAAMLEEARLAFKAIGDPLGAAQCTQSLGDVLRMQSPYTEAVPMLEEAKLAFEAIGNRHGAAECRRSLGDVLYMQSRYAEAAPMLEEAKLAFEAINKPIGAAQCTQRLGDVLLIQSRYTEAMAMLEKAKLVFEAIGQPLGAAQCMQSLADVLRMQSRYTEAVQMLEDAKLAFQTFGDLRGPAQCTQSLGDVLRMQCRYAEAAAILEEARLALKAIGEPLGAAQCTRSLGDVLRMQSRYAEAVPMLEAAKLAFEAIGDPLGAAQCTQILGDVLRMQSQYTEAVPILEEAKLAFEAIGEPLGAAQCTHSLADVLRMQCRYTEAMAMLEHAKLAFEAIGDPLGVAQCTTSVGRILLQQH
ncbi:TPR-like protein [Calocera viscosa TUFC12733]|uniref:TPR-like protein n=1 Tax=Calocera viscosa (strain TUFC12733) TaxID=1330018 RepID=A0A167HDQ0_CALVF|nr:TPR-like protein [Calocera viscosa TUFC12733]